MVFATLQLLDVQLLSRGVPHNIKILKIEIKKK